MTLKFLSLFVAILTLSTVFTACMAQPPTAALKPNPLFQTSTLSALQAGQYEGKMTIGELKQYGNFGLGTFNALDGEMVVVDGQVYQIKDDGLAYPAGNEAQTPFAAVTFFEPNQQFTINESFDCPQLQAHLDSLLPAVDTPYAVKVSGTFTHLKVRAPHRESQPYPALADALADQAIFESENATGDMIGFRLPDYMAGVNVAGYHFHFISQDRQTGGHVLDCQTGDLTIEVDAIDQFWLDVEITHLVKDENEEIVPELVEVIDQVSQNWQP